MSNPLFVQRQPKTMMGGAFATLALIYHLTVQDIRQQHRDPIFAVLTTILQSVVMIAGMGLMFMVFGVRSSPIRGDFMVYIMTGIFVYMTNVQAAMKVQGAGNALSAMMKHGPITAATLIGSAALSVLYRQTISCFVILFAYSAITGPISIYDPVKTYAVFMLAWLNGCAMGLIFLGITPWMPGIAPILTRFYVRINMVASGKMFLANAVPAFLMPYFAWNPLFHIIDQIRGAAFINYYPRNTTLSYPIYLTLTALAIGLMLEFVTRNKVSISWYAGR